MYERKIYKCGQVLIPKFIIKQLDLEEGIPLFVHYENGTIIIERSHDNQSLNQRYLYNGRINIPSEIRQSHDIKTEIYLKIDLDLHSKRILLKPNAS
ncbi:AbrB/MazE/SpoVT family DNA-binding domain-containing protein [Mesobacillus foraminis]|uniref:AbrB/MazE/SpoVT family DNA-binding domain-containing protein n=1 Tax=Mesobacillus foraminis TaxID=279826 RepID=UPI001BEC8BAA|nr:AbrB/MazE/SpoVT family DNA-binding domain-containing protein [Mesobacillus foraminis]MBT2758789.1 AbrB/MazE/SpoVT family DNA-binding domain-containing protein [Mesobacillus foraminis]